MILPPEFETIVHDEHGSQSDAAPLPALDPRAMALSDEAVDLGSCTQWDTIMVTTCSSVYELIVLQGKNGDVLARGGTHLPEFRRMTLAGSTAGGTALKVNTIDAGLRMELHAGGHVLVTSPVRSIVRYRAGRS
jgi:hypothetical protein